MLPVVRNQRITEPKEYVMNQLTARERELVALGAALGSNCVPCIEYHIPEARKAGLSDPQIAEVIQLADRVRQVPARKVLDAASKMLSETQPREPSPNQACAAAAPAAEAATPCCN
jgi:AhpD family alkylhydroperoxidase